MQMPLHHRQGTENSKINTTPKPNLASLLHFFAEYGQGVTYKSVGDPKTAASLPSPTHSQMTTSSKLHHGVSLPLNLALPIYSSTSLAVGGKQEEAVAGIPIASLPVPQT